MSNMQSWLNVIPSNRARRALRGLLSQFFDDSDPTNFVLAANRTAGLTISGAVTTGILISGSSTNAISITGTASTAAINITGGSIQQAITGEGYSLNLISITSTCTAGEGTRGWRVNVTTSAGIASGDLQCLHGYLTLGASATVAANAALYPLSGWIEIPDSTSFGNGCVVAGCRVIFDPNNNDLSVLGGGGESALFYGNVWASTGTIDHGFAAAIGAGATINELIHVGGSGTLGKLINVEVGGADDTLIILEGGPMDATATAHFKIAVGDATDHASIVADLGGTSYGSAYFSTAGKLWINESGTWTAQT